MPFATYEENTEMQQLYCGSYDIYGEFRRKLGDDSNPGFCFAFRIEYKHDSETYGLIEDINTMAFILELDEVKQIIRELQYMYDNLRGQCIIEEREDVSFLKLYFVGRFLKLKGKFSGEADAHLFGENLYWDKYDGGIDVDQTIFLPFINLFRSAIK